MCGANLPVPPAGTQPRTGNISNRHSPDAARDVVMEHPRLGAMTAAVPPPASTPEGGRDTLLLTTWSPGSPPPTPQRRHLGRRFGQKRAYFLAIKLTDRDSDFAAL